MYIPLQNSTCLAFTAIKYSSFIVSDIDISSYFIILPAKNLLMIEHDIVNATNIKHICTLKHAPGDAPEILALLGPTVETNTFQWQTVQIKRASLET